MTLGYSVFLLSGFITFQVFATLKTRNPIASSFPNSSYRPVFLFLNLHFRVIVSSFLAASSLSAKSVTVDIIEYYKYVRFVKIKILKKYPVEDIKN